jgi:hypothetical protein
MLHTRLQKQFFLRHSFFLSLAVCYFLIPNALGKGGFWYFYTTRHSVFVRWMFVSFRQCGGKLRLYMSFPLNISVYCELGYWACYCSSSKTTTKFQLLFSYLAHVFMPWVMTLRATSNCIVCQLEWHCVWVVGLEVSRTGWAHEVEKAFQLPCRSEPSNKRITA